MAKDRSYSELLSDLRGKSVFIWTCNTCARLCYEVGGTASAERLAAKLKEDGINVTGVGATSASCIESKVRAKSVADGTDVIVSLTCDLGAMNAESVFGIETMNPIETFGTGLLTDECGPVLIARNKDGSRSGKCLLELCGTRSPETLPFV